MNSIYFTTPTYATFHIFVQITRVGRDRDRALVFRGWSRLCLHAASLSTAEGGSVAARAAARAVRAKAMETEATAAAEKAEAWRVSADMAASTDQTRGGVTEALPSVAELEGREEAMGQVLREHREHRAKMLVSHIAIDSKGVSRRLGYRVWYRIGYENGIIRALCTRW